MPLSWNEIRTRSLAFSKRWENDTSEDAEAKSFWTEFLNVFGIDRKRVASFEEPVKKLGDKQGFIDLFWKGVTLVEHKSRGKVLDKAYTQALDYFPGIKERDLPKYVLVSDFARFRLYDLEATPSPTLPRRRGRKTSCPLHFRGSSCPLFFHVSRCSLSQRGRAGEGVAFTSLN
jgi:hypothetical protein